MNSLNFGQDTAMDKYDEFLNDYFNYKTENTSVRWAKTVAISAWHLIDWVFNEYKTIHGCLGIGDFRNELFRQCESLKIMHDIANATKHQNLTKPKAKIRNTKKHLGAYSSDYSSDYDITYLEIEMNDGKKSSFEEHIDMVKEFWGNYFGKLNINQVEQDDKQ